MVLVMVFWAESVTLKNKTAQVALAVCIKTKTKFVTRETPTYMFYVTPPRVVVHVICFVLLLLFA